MVLNIIYNVYILQSAQKIMQLLRRRVMKTHENLSHIICKTFINFSTLVFFSTAYCPLYILSFKW